MKFLSAAMATVLFLVSVECRVSAGDFDLEKLKSVHGRTYLDILILGADTRGLTFRHREGIAKIEFSSLSENVRMLYEVTEEVPGSDLEERGQDSPADEPSNVSAPGAGDLILTVYHRLTLYTSVNHHGVRPACQEGIDWLSSWPRCHPAHQLTRPCYRERAVRDFLLLSGLSRGACE